MSASQKIGIDTPRIDPARMAWSLARPGHRAEISPSGTATRSPMISAAVTSAIVAGAASPLESGGRPCGGDGTRRAPTGDAAQPYAFGTTDGPCRHTHVGVP